MKRIASLFLILTLFYNVLGLYLMFAEQQEQVWVNAMKKIDNSNFEIIEVHINPYAYIVDSGFEETNEDFVIGKKTYHVFKKRIVNNVLKLYCLKKSNKEVLNKDLSKIIDSQLFDSNSDKENSSKKMFKSFIKDFIQMDVKYLLPSIKSFSSITLYPHHPKVNLLSGYFSTNYPPPDVV
ncbi:hypothetical protein [Flavobacterium adhaerens]|uniref:hypothetical protein n=1 Tax=Flavobacterium adhaerens TaxID=3149043 RepID=UPI0032B4FA49